MGDKRLYDYRKANGLCVRCGQPSRPGKTMCEFHAQQEVERSREKRKALLAMGICPVCGSEKIYLNETKCPKCSANARESAARSKKKISIEENRAKYRVYSKKWRDTKREKGLCPRCGRRKPQAGKTLCRVCLDSDAFKYQMHKEGLNDRSERIAVGKCYFCGEDVMKGYKVCEKHYQCSVNNLPATRDNSYWRMDNKLLRYGGIKYGR